MRKSDGTILLSATDLMRFMGCAHATTLDLARLQGRGPEPKPDSEDAELLQKQGDRHEQAHLAALKASRRRVVEMDWGPLAQDARATQVALASGPEVILQGAFLSGNWGGWSDFLERMERFISAQVYEDRLTSHPSTALQSVAAPGLPPRGMDFLFSLNRINDAVSRAKGLALVFGSPRLRETTCETIQQMRLVNTLCALPLLPE